MEEISNKTAKLMFSEPILREKLTDLKEKNRGLFEAVQQMAEKYAQYAEVLTPLLESDNVTRKLLDKWSFTQNIFIKYHQLLDRQYAQR